MNRKYRFSDTSRKHIETLTKPLQDIVSEGIEIANKRALHCPDICITSGYRTAEQQYELYMRGRKIVDGEYIKVGSIVTNCDGFKYISEHQSIGDDGGGMAFDFCAWVGRGVSYKESDLALIATCFFEAASNQGYVIDWGGNYRSISDGSHISLVTR